MSAVKICGLRDQDSLQAAIRHRAKYIGFVFYPPSPRYINAVQAELLSRHIITGVRAVGLFVDPSDEELNHILSHVPLDMIQLHGSESPGRVAEVRSAFGLPVMKAIAVKSSVDLVAAEGYEEVADWLLFDTKTEEHGGSGISFDWDILKGKTFKRPWMLAGGLNVHNIVHALSLLNPDAVDVSSGVEKEKGVKDPEKIREFLETVRMLDKDRQNQ